MKNDIDSFIIRIWNEGTDNHGRITAWRGSIDHVGTERRFYFNELEKMIRFIETESGISSRPAKSPGQQALKIFNDFLHLLGIKKHAQDPNRT